MNITEADLIKYVSNETNDSKHFVDCALNALYLRQTEDERAERSSIHKNRQGFDRADAARDICTLTPLQKTELVVKYMGQVAQMLECNENLQLPPEFSMKIRPRTRRKCTFKPGDFDANGKPVRPVRPDKVKQFVVSDKTCIYSNGTTKGKKRRVVDSSESEDSGAEYDDDDSDAEINSDTSTESDSDNKSESDKEHNVVHVNIHGAWQNKSLLCASKTFINAILNVQHLVNTGESPYWNPDAVHKHVCNVIEPEGNVITVNDIDAILYTNTIEVTVHNDMKGYYRIYSADKNKWVSYEVQKATTFGPGYATVVAINIETKNAETIHPSLLYCINK